MIVHLSLLFATAIIQQEPPADRVEAQSSVEISAANSHEVIEEWHDARKAAHDAATGTSMIDKGTAEPGGVNEYLQRVSEDALVDFSRECSEHTRSAELDSEVTSPVPHSEDPFPVP